LGDEAMKKPQPRPAVRATLPIATRVSDGELPEHRRCTLCSKPDKPSPARCYAVQPMYNGMRKRYYRCTVCTHTYKVIVQPQPDVILAGPGT
jgi:hypothetical protein